MRRSSSDRNPPVHLRERVDAPSLVGLARARALEGDRAAAKKAYEQFFEFWKDADPDIPLLVAAHKEYSALR